MNEVMDFNGWIGLVWCPITHLTQWLGADTGQQAACQPLGSQMRALVCLASPWFPWSERRSLCVFVCVCEWVRLIVYKMTETGFEAYTHITHVYKHVHVFCFSCVHLRVCACTVLVWAYPTDYFIWPTVPTIWNMGSSAGSLLWNSRWHFLEGSACALKQGSIFGQRLHWIYCVPRWHECLLDQLINLLFRMDSDHEKLSKLQSCAVFLTNLKQPHFTEYFPKAIFV